MFKKQNNNFITNMFKNNETKPQNAETIIGPSIKVKGNFYGDGDMIIDGIVEGNIKTNSFLLSGKKSEIKADIKAQNAKIGGVVFGNIIVDGYLEILSSAKITGDIQATQISIEKGAIFNGKCSMNKKEQEKETKL